VNEDITLADRTGPMATSVDMDMDIILVIIAFLEMATSVERVIKEEKKAKALLAKNAVVDEEVEMEKVQPEMKKEKMDLHPK